MPRVLFSLKPTPIGRMRQSLRGLCIGGAVVPFILLVWAGGLFAQTRLRLNDAYYAPSPVVSDTVVIVAIDNDSLAAYGRTTSEWSRLNFAKFMDIVSAGGARVVAFDILFSEATDDDDVFISAIQNARQSEARTRVIMPIAGLSVSEADVSQALAYHEVITPQSHFLEAIDNVGFVNAYPDNDRTVRRYISRAVYPCVGEDCPEPLQTGYSLAVATYLAYLRIPVLAIPQVMRSDDGGLWITEERRISVDENGLWLPNFFSVPNPDESVFTVVSFVDVLEGRVDPALFDEKAVMVGVMNSTGSADVYHVPTSNAGVRMFGVEIHANAFESIYWNVSYREAGAMTEIILISIIALTASLTYAHLRWWWMIVMGVVLAFAWALVSVVHFDTTREMVDLLFIFLAIALPILGNLLLDVVMETIRRERTEAQLKIEKDLSALRLQMIEEKDQQNQTLAELSMLKTQMIRMASHDLKNPLGIIITYGSLIQEDVLSDPSVMKADHARFIDNMVKSAHDMLTIIEEILNLEQLRSGNIKKDPLAIGYVVSAVVAQNQMESVDKNHTITLKMEDHLPLVMADYRQLYQAVTNLVGNAVKYTPYNGTIDVRVRMNGDMLRLEVQDNGYGISEEGQKNLFKEFYRVRSAKTAHIQGTGLGLSLVKAVIEAHNGKIWVESQEGVGSTFFVELPKFEGTLNDDE